MPLRWVGAAPPRAPLRPMPATKSLAEANTWIGPVTSGNCTAG
jgi:hypothetical protein